MTPTGGADMKRRSADTQLDIECRFQLVSPSAIVARFSDAKNGRRSDKILRIPPPGALRQVGDLSIQDGSIDGLRNGRQRRPPFAPIRRHRAVHRHLEWMENPLAKPQPDQSTMERMEAANSTSIVPPLSPRPRTCWME
tara:strand:+ start:439 stop:855 length:417 start_codon:yes stop_codon:yes gene_type:complete